MEGAANLAPEWAQVEFSVAVTLSGAACGQLAWRGGVRGSFARFGAKMAAAAQLQNDAGGGRGWRVAVSANLSRQGGGGQQFSQTSQGAEQVGGENGW